MLSRDLMVMESASKRDGRPDADRQFVGGWDGAGILVQGGALTLLNVVRLARASNVLPNSGSTNGFGSC
jgi:hypothetical protein